jgi:hypothetical protein
MWARRFLPDFVVGLARRRDLFSSPGRRGWRSRRFHPNSREPSGPRDRVFGDAGREDRYSVSLWNRVSTCRQSPVLCPVPVGGVATEAEGREFQFLLENYLVRFYGKRFARLERELRVTSSRKTPSVRFRACSRGCARKKAAGTEAERRGAHSPSPLVPGQGPVSSGSGVCSGYGAAGRLRRLADDDDRPRNRHSCLRTTPLGCRPRKQGCELRPDRETSGRA